MRVPPAVQNRKLSARDAPDRLSRKSRYIPAIFLINGPCSLLRTSMGNFQRVGAGLQTRVIYTYLTVI